MTGDHLNRSDQVDAFNSTTMDVPTIGADAPSAAAHAREGATHQYVRFRLGFVDRAEIEAVRPSPPNCTSGPACDSAVKTESRAEWITAHTLAEIHDHRMDPRRPACASVMSLEIYREIQLTNSIACAPLLEQASWTMSSDKRIIAHISLMLCF